MSGVLSSCEATRRNSSRRSIASWASANRRAVVERERRAARQLLGQPQVGGAVTAPGRGRQQGHDAEAPVAREERNRGGRSERRAARRRGAARTSPTSGRSGDARRQGPQRVLHRARELGRHPRGDRRVPGRPVGEVHVDDAPVGQLGHRRAAPRSRGWRRSRGPSACGSPRPGSARPARPACAR